jgi:hypothetical protein
MPPGSSDRNPWLLLIHSIPPKPDYFRVKIGRRLQRVGALPIKNSVYVLPARDATVEDFEWIVREIVEGGGEASVCEASFVDGLSNAEVERMFVGARDADYGVIAEEAAQLSASLPKARRLDADRRAQVAADLARLKRRLGEVAAIDFFESRGRARVESAIAQIEAGLRDRRSEEHGGHAGSTAVGSVRGHTWVTRRDVHEDRIASAWLIRRFIDPEAHFKFVAPKGYKPATGELRFDMYEAEYTHEGDRCTFETLVDRFGLSDPALEAIGEIVHMLDLKDGKFARAEAPGIERLIAGIVFGSDDDALRLERGRAMLDDLYTALSKSTATRARSTPARGRTPKSGHRRTTR